MNQAQMNNPLKLVFLSFLIIMWFILTALLGLLQVWVSIILAYISNAKGISDTLSEFYRSGALSFFSTAIIATVTIDYYVLRERKRPIIPNEYVNRLFITFIFIFIPTVLIICNIPIFMSTTVFQQFECECSINYHDTHLQNLQLASLGVTFIYSFVVKLITQIQTDS